MHPGRFYLFLHPLLLSGARGTHTSLRTEMFAFWLLSKEEETHTDDVLTEQGWV